MSEPKRYILPWDETNFNSCCVCHIRRTSKTFKEDTGGLLTVIPPWRDWRPQRYVCDACCSLPKTIDILSVIDALYLNTVPVYIRKEWNKQEKFKIINIKINNAQVDENWNFYKTYNESTCWLRLYYIEDEDDVDDINLTFGIQMRKGTTGPIVWMDINEFATLNQLPTFKFNFIYNHGKTISELTELMVPHKQRYLKILESYIDPSIKVNL